jgi:hypothetical protein
LQFSNIPHAEEALLRRLEARTVLVQQKKSPGSLRGFSIYPDISAQYE